MAHNVAFIRIRFKLMVQKLSSPRMKERKPFRMPRIMAKEHIKRLN